jgi:hypothetical protein
MADACIYREEAVRRIMDRDGRTREEAERRIDIQITNSQCFQARVFTLPTIQYLLFLCDAHSQQIQKLAYTYCRPTGVCIYLFFTFLLFYITFLS